MFSKIPSGRSSAAPFSQPMLSAAMTASPAHHPFPMAQFHRASEGQVHYYVRQIEARCPRVFGHEKQAFPTHIAAEVRSMLGLLRQRAEAAGESLGPVRLGSSDADLGVLADTITTDQLDSMQDAFGMLELALEQQAAPAN